jgi:hypothetical protein
MARKQVEQFDDDDEFETAESAVSTGARARMVDWLQCCKLPLLFTVIFGFTVYSHLTNSKASGEAFPLLSFAIFVPIGLFAVVSQLSGFLFDEAKDRLSYPMYIFRRSVPLSEIDDANCETISKPAFRATNTIIGVLSGHQFKAGKTKRYIVNISGEFGSRRIILHTKQKRDQFLSLLHAYAPHCRITRWV